MITLGTVDGEPGIRKVISLDYILSSPFFLFLTSWLASSHCIGCQRTLAIDPVNFIHSNWPVVDVARRRS